MDYAGNIKNWINTLKTHKTFKNVKAEFQKTVHDVQSFGTSIKPQAEKKIKELEQQAKNVSVQLKSLQDDIQTEIKSTIQKLKIAIRKAGKKTVVKKSPTKKKTIKKSTSKRKAIKRK
jgi:hypothetical protein